jgi:hypothetical protein
VRLKRTPDNLKRSQPFGGPGFGNGLTPDAASEFVQFIHQHIARLKRDGL